MQLVRSTLTEPVVGKLITSPGFVIYNVAIGTLSNHCRVVIDKQVFQTD